MQTLDYITIVLLLAGIFVAGSLFFGSGHNLRSFFAGGGNIPWWIGGLSLFMSFFSAGTFVVWGSIAYTEGWTAVTIQWMMAGGGVIAGLLIAPRWNRTGCLTAAEYITRRFGARVQKFYTALFLSVSLFSTGTFLYSIARIVETAVGISFITSIQVLGLLCILYVAIGGFRAVVVTDVLQFLILTAAVVIVLPLAFERIGGTDTLFRQTPEGFFRPAAGEYTWGFMLASLLGNASSLGGNWAFVQRYTSVATPAAARKTGLLFGALYLVCPVVWMLPPMLFRLHEPSLTGFGSENAYLLMCREVLPPGLLGLMLGGMIFATLSSFNTILNTSASVVTNDLLKPLLRRFPERTLMRAARLSTVVFGVLAVTFALLIPRCGGIVNVVISIGAMTTAPMCLPVVWSLYSKGLSGRAVLSTTLAALGINLAFKFAVPLLFGFSLSRAGEMALGVLGPGGHPRGARGLPPVPQTRHAIPDAAEVRNPRRRFRRPEQPFQPEGDRRRRNALGGAGLGARHSGSRRQPVSAGHRPAPAGRRTAALFPQPSDLNPASLPAAPFSAGSGAFYCVFLNYFAIFVRL